MNERIYKYDLPLSGDMVAIPMPAGAVVLCVQVQLGRPRIWARVDIAAPLVTHYFRIAGTGHTLGDGLGRYIGSFQMEGGVLVFHVFEATS